MCSGLTSAVSGSGLLFVRALAAVCLLNVGVISNAATITVTSLDDDVFVNSSGATFSDVALTVAVAPTKCTLRMAIAAANLDVAVGGCAAGDSETLAGAQASGIPDQIVFAAALAAGGAINLNTNALMSPAPAQFTAGLGSVAPAPGSVLANTQSILVVSRPLYILGPTDGSGAPTVTLNGGAPSLPTSVDARILIANDGIHSIDTPLEIDNLKFANARSTGAGGCVFSRESVRFFNVRFDNCVSDGVPGSAGGYGGALGVFTTPSGSQGTTHTRPSISLSSVTATNNRALRNGAPTASLVGAFAFGTGVGRVGHVVLRNVTMSGNQADSVGALLIRNALSADLREVTVNGNSAIGAYDADPVLNSGIVGGVLIRLARAVSLSDVNITGNTAGQNTGGLEVRQNVSVYATGLNVSGNGVNATASATGAFYGGANFASNITVVIDQSMVSNNILDAHPTFGGQTAGLNIENSTTVSVTDSVISNNIANNAAVGGLTLFGSTTSATLTRVDINGNRTVRVGGGTSYVGNGAMNVFNNTALTISESSIRNNESADFTAVAISASRSDRDQAGNPANPLPPTTNTVLISRSYIGRNSARNALMYFQTPGEYVVRNSTIANNSVQECGGGISADGYNPNSTANAFRLKVLSTTIARNFAGTCQSAFGAGAWNGSGQGAFNGSIEIASTIIGNYTPTATTDTLFVVNPAVLSVTKSLFEDGGGSANALCGTSGNLCNTDAKLDLEGDWGGFSATLRPKRGSPAIDAGSNAANVTWDQRRASRVRGAAADIGAYETDPADPVANCSFDMDGANGVQAFREGLVLLRSMLGFGSTAAVAGTGITESQWNATRANLNANCGTALP